MIGAFAWWKKERNGKMKGFVKQIKWPASRRAVRSLVDNGDADERQEKQRGRYGSK